ncbi:FxsA family protein [Neogemmobacter tilapiae]|uniref:FxsA family protein n=1 Tax=Neogemmobacter tilapiae TaxID=875041 RepID=A0A918WHD5_9RHOB|nr:FxsA family protein [Gemmobacter tilapiae]GHC51767.1 hypothetical protein GCM10007315_12730 [Gemmobacter tilapiae]
MQILLPLLLWPLIEIGLFVTIGGRIGLWATMAIILGTFALGIFVIRLQGGGAIMRARQGLRAGQAPTQDLGRGLFGVIAGILLILPGFLTDVLGLILLLPPVQSLLAGAVLSRMGGQGTTRSATIIDGEWHRMDEPGQAPMRDITKD